MIEPQWKKITLWEKIIYYFIRCYFCGRPFSTHIKISRKTLYLCTLHNDKLRDIIIDVEEQLKKELDK